MDIRFSLAQAQKRSSFKKKPFAVTSLKNIKSPEQQRYSDKQKKGLSYEQIALEFLQTKGLVLLEKNLFCKMGEIDLVMQDSGQLVFVEVRYRQNKQYGGALSSITAQKYHRLLRTAQYFLPLLQQKHFRGNNIICRFDAIGFHGDNETIEWIKNITL